MKNAWRPIAAALSLALLVGETLAVEPEKWTVATATVSNPSEFARADEVARVRLIDLGIEPGSSDAESLVAYSGERMLPIQTMDTDHDGSRESVALLLDLPAAGSVEIDFEIDAEAARAHALPRRTYAEISRKFGGEWQGREYVGGEFGNAQYLAPPPEHTDHSYFIRYEGPGWESEKVGYRFYLDWRNGFDIFGKLTPALVLKDVGQDGFDSYHEPAAWGMDILKVGDALGAGGFGLWVDGAVERVSKVDSLSVEILANGPVLSKLRTRYAGWQGKGLEKQDLVSTISIHAGSRLSWIDLRPESGGGRLCAGIVKSESADAIRGDTDIPGNAYTYLATWGPQSLDGSDLGMALIVRKGELDRFAEDALNHVAVFKKSARSVEYAMLAAWSKEPGGIADKEAFLAYLDETIERLTLAPRISVRSSLEAAVKEEPITSKAALDWTVRLAVSEAERRGDSLAYGNYDPEARRPARWTYTTGLLGQAMLRVAEAAGRPELADWARETISSFLTEDGLIATYDLSDFNIDHVNSGKLLVELHAMTGDHRYREAAALLRRQLAEHPRTGEGAFWHKKIYPSQVWLDGVYMGLPFLAAYERAFAEGDWEEEAIHEFRVVEKQLRDEKTGLYYHAWDESREQGWADSETGRSEFFWGRGLGWYAMALVDTLEHLKPDSAQAKELRRLLGDLAEAIVRVQDPNTGVWYQILDQPSRLGNYPEASATSMFVYMLAKGVNRGWLDARYADAAEKGFRGALDLFVRPHPDGSASLVGICQVAGLGFGRDGSYRYYMSEPVVANDPKGVGPFLLAGVQISELLNEDSEQP